MSSNCSDECHWLRNSLLSFVTALANPLGISHSCSKNGLRNSLAVLNFVSSSTANYMFQEKLGFETSSKSGTKTSVNKPTTGFLWLGKKLPQFKLVIWLFGPMFDSISEFVATCFFTSFLFWILQWFSVQWRKTKTTAAVILANRNKDKQRKCMYALRAGNCARLSRDRFKLCFLFVKWCKFCLFVVVMQKQRKHGFLSAIRWTPLY